MARSRQGESQNRTHECSECGATFDDAEDLASHERMVHNDLN